MTALLTEPWPHGLLTLEDWDALPPYEGFRLELVEGVLTPMAAPRSWHQNTGTNLPYRTDEQLPHDLIALSGVAILLSDPPPTVRIPDMIVTLTAAHEANPSRFDAADVRLVVEILSDGTRKVDRILKSAEYAEAGVPRYWILDIDGAVTLVSYLLVDGAYELVGEFTGTAQLDLDGYPVTLDLEALVRR